MTPWATEVAEATSRGAKVVISASAQFFDGSFKLRSDWSTQWNSILQFIKASPKGSIAAIYPLDEPYNNGWNGGDTSAMINALRTLANQIHADTKAQLGVGLPVAVIQRITEVGCSSAVCPIDMFDWVGFDCYGPWNNCQGTNLHDIATQLRAKLSSSQRMIAVPWAFLYQPAGNAPATQYADIDVINHWQREIMADPSYVAVVPFLWQSGYIDGPSNPPAYGTIELPLIKERLYQFAHTVLHPDSTIYPLDYNASSSTADSLPFYAFDRITSNGWNSGTFPQAWILADFGGSTRVKRISVTYGQYPAGQTTNIIEGCPNQYYCSNNMWSQLVNYQGYTQDGNTLSWPINTDATQIRVRTTQSPSWVAWKEISFSQ